MKKSEQIENLYKSILLSLGIETDDEGQLMYAADGEVDSKGQVVQPILRINGKAWVLPIERVLDDGAWEKVTPFHPLSENFAHGESETFTRLKGLINSRLSMHIMLLMGHLADFAANTDGHSKAPVKATKYLKDVNGFKPKTAELVWKLAERASNDDRPVNIFLRRGGKVDGVPHTFASIVSFPMRLDMDDAGSKVFGIEIGAKTHRKALISLFDYMFPQNESAMRDSSNEKEGTYSGYSDSASIPRFQALLRAFVKLATRLNELTTTHSAILPAEDRELIDLSWADQIDHLDTLADIIPPLPGNIGKPLVKRSAEEATPQAAPATKRPKISVNANENTGNVESAPSRAQGQPPAPAPAEPVYGYQPPATQPNAPQQEEPRKASFADRLRQAKEREQQQAQQQYQGYRSAATYGTQNYQAQGPSVPDWMQQGQASGATLSASPQPQQQGYGYANRNQGGYAGRNNQQGYGYGNRNAQQVNGGYGNRGYGAPQNYGYGNRGYNR